MTSSAHRQRSVAAALLSRLGPHGFALSGAGALREHGLLDRPTEDIDLFCARLTDEEFQAATDETGAVLARAGYHETRRVDVPGFLRLQASSNDGESTVDVDLGRDYRVLEPVRLEIGPVLALEDAVGNKVAALFSRGEARDFLDVDSIRRSRRFSDAQLLQLAAERDGGFTVDMFRWRLASIAKLPVASVAPRYELTPDAFRGVRRRLTSWSHALAPRPRDIHGDRGAGLDGGPLLGPSLH